jgi:hypothetical protein
VNLIVQSIGLDYTELCPANGPFSEGLNSLSACISAHSDSGNLSTLGLIESAVEFCSAKSNTFTSISRNVTAIAIALTSVCCGTDEGAKALISSCDAYISK